MRVRPYCWASALVFLAMPTWAASTGSISGRVLNAQGAPLKGALVQAYTLPANTEFPHLPPTPVDALVDSAVSGPSGVFTVQNLPAEAVILCVDPRQSGLLNPCLWSQTPPVVQLTEGQRVLNYELRLEAGSVVKVRIQDPQKLVGQDAAGKERQLRTGVFGPTRLFHPAFLTGVDAAGRDHELTVPFGLPVRFILHSKDLDILDDLGIAIPAAGHSSTLKLAAGPDNQKVLTFSVAGAKP